MTGLNVFLLLLAGFVTGVVSVTVLALHLVARASRGRHRRPSRVLGGQS